MISSFRHLEIIKPPLDVLLQEITQVLLMVKLSFAVRDETAFRIQQLTTSDVFWLSGKVSQSSKQA